MSRNVFSPFENELLNILVKKKIDVIECKELSKISSRKKAEAFDEIAKEFNCSKNVIPRTAQQLRQRYLNVKKLSNKTRANTRQESRKTGGGMGPTNQLITRKIDNMQEKTLILGVTPLPTIYTSDFSRLDFSFQENEYDSQQETTVHDISEDEASENLEADELLLLSKNTQVLEQISEERPKSRPEIKVPSKRPQCLELFCRRASPKSSPTLSSSARSAATEEIKQRMEFEKIRLQREQKEQMLKMELLNKEFNLKAELCRKKIEAQQKKIEVQQKKFEVRQKKIEAQQKKCEAQQKKIDVQNKILDLLHNNPDKLNFK